MSSPESDSSPLTSIHVFFGSLDDPRMDRTKKHDLLETLVLVLSAVICGADSYTEIETFGKARLGLFRTFLTLPHGIPSHDTIGRIMAALDPGELAESFTAWVMWLCEDLAGEIIPIDGKTVRRSYDKASGKSAVHLVSAWALGQVAVADKSNEITAIPMLLRMLDIRGATITTDAMGCQTQIAAQIIEQEGDYVLAVKGNQEKLYEDVKRTMNEVRQPVNAAHVGCFESTEKGHGRIETRKVWSTDRVDWLHEKDRWEGLSGVAMVESTRTVNQVTTTELRYYITSRKGINAGYMAHAIRGHWAIENSQHWVLDMVFDEDGSRIRMHNADENMALMRKMALNLIKREKSTKASVKTKRLRAAWEPGYLFTVLAAESAI
jgi:predicted transposase YbfD/YdcC